MTLLECYLIMFVDGFQGSILATGCNYCQYLSRTNAEKVSVAVGLKLICNLNLQSNTDSLAKPKSGQADKIISLLKKEMGVEFEKQNK